MTPSDRPLLQLFDDASSTYTYVAYDPDTLDAVIIDPVLERVVRDVAALEERGLTLRWAIETHAHADHITGTGALAQRLGAGTAAPVHCGIAAAQLQVRHGQELVFGRHALLALHTPGHTEGSTCYVWRTRGAQCVFTGDTLLIGGCGRTDFQSGSAHALYDSITQQLFTLPDDTVVLPGHDYQGRSYSTIGHERANNPRLAGRSRQEFADLMAALRLPAPRLMDVAVPANRSLGMTVRADTPHASDGG
jgi:sulfur dioxygenase